MFQTHKKYNNYINLLVSVLAVSRSNFLIIAATIIICCSTKQLVTYS